MPEGHARTEAPPFKKLPMKGPDVSVDRRADGIVYVRSNHAPGDRPRSIPHLLDEKAKEHPERPYLKQRLPNHGPWRGVSYGEAARQSGAAAEKLYALGLGPHAPLMVLSGNSIEHAIMMLAAMKIRAPVAPLSPSYSLMSADFAKLKHCFNVVKPKAIFVQSKAPFQRALDSLDLTGVEIITVDDEPTNENVLRYSDLIEGEAGAAVAVEMDKITDKTIAKFLFTSGSTGLPKAAPQYQGMLCSQISASEGLRNEDPDPEQVPQSLEWMPWSHISAGNVGFNGALWSGATVHLDEGKPLPGMFETTIKNLYEVSPIVFGSAPIAFAMLADAMEKDPKLRASFFKNLRYMGYGGATLQDDLYDRLQALAIAETGQRIPLTTMYGATETQGITVVHWEAERVGLIGLPLPGITLKLVPNGEKLEVRVKGPTVTTGYWGDEEKTAAAFDEEGYYKLGDACRFVDENDPAKGLIFDGRVTEDFKLSSGTWVSVGTLRPDIVAACSPYVFDGIVTGQDKPFIGALLWPSPAGMAALAQEGSNPLEKLAHVVKERIAAFNTTAGGSSRRIVRVQIMTEPPSIDAGEITDKGYVNQRAALERRKALVDALYAEPPGAGVIVI
ncbi:MAG: AMP-binding protein [Hyphomonadaceae bacterium]